MQEDGLTESQLEELLVNDLLSEWLGECRFTADNVSQINDALALFATKRTTLEEKIIRKEMHNLVSNYCAILTVVHRALADEKQPHVDALERLRLLNFRVRENVGRLLKALHHSFNYVEQYFEFSYCSRLTQEDKFAEEADSILKLVSGEEAP